LDHLSRSNQSCGPEPIASKQYAAYFMYGAALENEGEPDSAVEQYRAAVSIDAKRREALEALIRLDALPDPTPAPCLSAVPPGSDPAPEAAPATSQFVMAKGNQLMLQSSPFRVKGVNYYPRTAPWQRFLAEFDPLDVATELDLIRQAGFNTLRVFLWYEPLFTCNPEHAVPVEAQFAKIDTLLKLAHERDLKLIVTLNDLPDLTFRPLYTDWSHHDAQTVYIVRRYRNEPGILAWDLRNEGDLDYGVQPGWTPVRLFQREEVVTWLGHVSQLVRDNDPHHLITAGWWGDPLETVPYVDIVSFHHWSEAGALRTRLENYRQRTDKPLMLQEVGYHSWAEAPADPRDQTAQADLLGRVVGTVDQSGAAGWLVWTAFDFEPEPGQPLNFEHYFGLWTLDLKAKPALMALPLP
jgi:hypothetical protein